MPDLFVTEYTPQLGVGRHVGTYGVVRALAALGPLDLVYVRHGTPDPAPKYQAIEGLSLHEVVPSRGLVRALTYARALARSIPPGFARGISPELIATATTMAAAPQRARVVADGPVVMAALRRLARRRPVIYSAHDLESAFRADVHPRLEAFERGLLESAAESWMVSAKDVDGARALAPRAAVRYLPAAIDVAGIEPVAPAGGQRALFVANFAWPPNVSGLRYLVDEVMPRVWEVLPDARLTIVGKGLDGPPSSDPRVEALGFVEDLRDAYVRADCVVVPLLEGGGVPIKLLEALAHGLPIVATPKGVAGTVAEPGVHYREGADAESFAAALAEVLRSGDRELAARGRRLAEEHYSVEATARRIAAPPPTLSPVGSALPAAS